MCFSFSSMRLLRSFLELNGQQLLLIVPFVDCGAYIQSFVTLQSDQLSSQHRSQGLGYFGLSKARLAFNQQGLVQFDGEIDGCCQRAICNVTEPFESQHQFIRIFDEIGEFQLSGVGIMWNAASGIAMKCAFRCGPRHGCGAQRLGFGCWGIVGIL